MDENYENQLYKFYKKFENDFKMVNDKYPLLFRKEENSFDDKIDYLNINEIKNINNKELSNDSNDENKIMDKRRLKSINKKVIGDSNNYRKYIELSFLKYNFDDSQIQFKQIKMLCFLYILKYMPKTNNALKLKEIFLIENYKNIVKESEGLAYIDRIRILISFINNKIFDTDYSLINCYTFLIRIDDTKNKCDYIGKAYKILYQILDNSQSPIPNPHLINEFIIF